MSYYFPTAWDMYRKDRTPFMYELYNDMQLRRPYAGLKVLHNLPIMISDLLKIDCLLVSGAEVTITMPRFVTSDLEAFELVKNAPINFIQEHSFTEQYDVLLDCCGELAEVTIPKIGAVEITQTGANKYRRMQPSYPVISIDDSKLKFLEDSIGSADGFMRALNQLVKADLKHQKYIVFGFGKVGVGIARELKKISNDVTVIDQLPAALNNAKKLGYHTISALDKKLVEQHVQASFGIVTATGDKGFISREFDKEKFAHKLLVNIGAEDEFGAKFKKSEVLNDKMPVNFVLKEPTKIEYLDPAYYAHNTCIDLILHGNFSHGVHPLPKEIDNSILTKWFDFHNESRAEFNLSLQAQYDYTA